VSKLSKRREIPIGHVRGSLNPGAEFAISTGEEHAPAEIHPGNLAQRRK